jgi:hypothetical protein
MTEIWKPITGYEGYYEVSNLGNVRSIARVVNCNGHPKQTETFVLLPLIDRQGYYKIQLHKDGNVKTFKVHRLVAMAFLPNDNHYRCINHKDEDKGNNCVTNLEWCTHKYNTNYGTGIRRRVEKQRKAVVKYDSQGNKIARYNSIGEASKKTGICGSGIGQCCSGNKKYSVVGGFIWRFEKDGIPKTLPKDTRVLKLSLSGNIIATYNSVAEATSKNNILRTSIYNCLAGRSKSAGGYIWKRKTEAL